MKVLEFRKDSYVRAKDAIKTTVIGFEEFLHTVVDCGLPTGKDIALRLYADPSTSVVLVKNLLKDKLVGAVSEIKVLGQVSLGSYSPLFEAVEGKLSAAINKFTRIRNRRGMDGVDMHLKEFDFQEDGTIIYPESFDDIIRADFTTFAESGLQEAIYDEAVKLRDAIQAFSDKVWALKSTNPNLKVRGVGSQRGWGADCLITYHDDEKNQRKFEVRPELIPYLTDN